MGITAVLPLGTKYSDIGIAYALWYLRVNVSGLRMRNMGTFTWPQIPISPYDESGEIPSKKLWQMLLDQDFE